MSSSTSFSSQRRGWGRFRLPTSLKLPLADADDDLLGELDAIPARPVFIMGLHRSGTTFLYECMARSFPLAHLSLHHLLNYEGLLVEQRDCLEQEHRDRLNTALVSLGITDRTMDEIAVNDETLEEYGFLLLRLSGYGRIVADNLGQVDLIVRKLISVQSPAQSVLLKNPWDNGNGGFILDHFPEARFVYITREPLAILSSQLNAMLAFLDGPQPYLRLLLETGPQPHNRWPPSLVNAMIGGLRGLRRLLGTGRVASLARSKFAKSLVQDLVAYQADLAVLPRERVLEIDYADLVADPIAEMQRLSTLLELPVNCEPELIRTHPRRNLNPVLADFGPELDRLLAEAGV